MTQVEWILGLYLLAVLGIGTWGQRLFRGSSDDWFLASRTIGPGVLLLSLFGTNMTAFSILGASGEAYREGIAVFALMGSSSALVIPLVTAFVGSKLWALSRRHGYLTQAQYFRDRYGSDALGLLVFTVLLALMLPYLLIGVKGAGDALSAVTEGRIPMWIGSAAVCGVIFVYVNCGGMRSTAWVNSFQTLSFMILGGLTCAFVLGRHGGVTQVFATLAERRPDLLMVGEPTINMAKFVSFLLLPLSVGMFPHIFTHWLTARSANTLRHTIAVFPLCVLCVWIPSVVLGVAAHLDHPTPPQGPVVVALVLQHSSGLMVGLLATGILAAIMSSLDSQVLSVSSMFTHDVLQHHGHLRDERHRLWAGRSFVAAILLAVFGLSLLTTRSIFSMGVWSLSGYAALFPVIVAALYWRRSTASGVAAAITSVLISWPYFFFTTAPGQTASVGESGLLPVAVMFAASAASLGVVSVCTQAPDAQRLQRHFAPRSRGRG